MGNDTVQDNGLDSHAKNASAFFEALIGNWNTAFHCALMPEPIRGSCRSEWVQQGRSIVQTLESSGGDFKFRSIRMLCFNPLRNRIEAASLEGAGVGIATGVGAIGDAGRSLHLISRVDEQHENRQDVPTETVHAIQSDGSQQLNIYELSREGRVEIGTVVYLPAAASEESGR